MDPISILVAIVLFVSTSANFSGAKKGMKSKLANVSVKPNSYLQKIPPNVAAIVFIIIILAIFNIGVLSNEIKEEFIDIRIIGFAIFALFSWMQIFSYKALDKFYSQDIIIFKNHELKTKGIYKCIRHPQYLAQLLSDFGVGIALMGYLVIPLIIFIELPLFILRAKKEEELLQNHFNKDFEDYKNKAGFFIPFIG